MHSRIYIAAAALATMLTAPALADDRPSWDPQAGSPTDFLAHQARSPQWVSSPASRAGAAARAAQPRQGEIPREPNDPRDVLLDRGFNGGR